ncbi:MAG TPA: T9SS type A sorting domain-containing protein [Chitinophagales bacterium]|nr:T9SS type A sorting domain-containing protein [Chitinophagales bacterium]
MKTQLQKKIYTFILIAIGMFSFTSISAQGNAKVPQCNCASLPLMGCGSNDFGCQLYCGGKCADYCAKHPNQCKSAEGDATYGTLFTTIFPNPVSTSTTISFSVGQTENVSVRIFDMMGRLIKTLADGSFTEGDYEVEWSPGDLTAGNYFLQTQSTSDTEVILLSLVK